MTQIRIQPGVAAKCAENNGVMPLANTPDVLVYAGDKEVIVVVNGVQVFAIDGDCQLQLDVGTEVRVNRF
jgi:hypothetical protein